MAVTKSTWSLIQQTNHLKIYFILKTKLVIFFIFFLFVGFVLSQFWHMLLTVQSLQVSSAPLISPELLYQTESILLIPCTKTPSNTFHCDTCQETITTRTAFVHHVRGHSKARKEINNNCDKFKRVVILSIIKEELEQLEKHIC